MSSSDDLTIALFFLATALTVGCTAVTAAGYRHPVFIRGLYVLAAICVIVGFGWSDIKVFSPRATDEIAKVATSAWAWFLLLIIGMGAILLLSRKPKDGGGRSTQVAQPPIDVPAPPKERIFLEVGTQFFLDLYKDKTTIQATALAAPYLGKWLRVSGTIDDISESTAYSKDFKEMIILRVNLITREGDWHADYLWFDQTWKQKILPIGRGGKITAIGRIDRIEFNHLSFRNCELVED